MATRAHALRDYSLAAPSSRPRRQVWIDPGEDEVVLPRGRSERVGGALIVSAVLATALVGGAAYAIYWSAPPQLSESQAAPLEKTYSEDPLVGRANMARALAGPARSTPPAPLAEGQAAATAGVPAREASSEAVIFDDSAPGFQQSLPQPSVDERARTQSALAEPSSADEALPRPEAPSGGESQPLYPPLTTPPEMVEPPSLPEPSLPRLDPDNPY